MVDTLVAADLDTHAHFNPALNRKPLSAVAHIGYYGDGSGSGGANAPRITKLVAPNGQYIVPRPSYRDSGRVSDDGFEFNTELKMTEQRGMGSYAVLRRDMMSKDFTVEFSFLETHKLAYEVQNNLDLSAVKMSSDGEFRFSHPSSVTTVYFRLLIIGRDGYGADLTYMAKYFPRVTLTAKAKESWQDKAEGLPRQVTLGADEDPVLRTSCVEYLFGPGALNKAAAMGIEVDTVAAA